MLNSERYTYTKKLLFGNVPPRDDDIPCLQRSICISTEGPVALMF